MSSNTYSIDAIFYHHRRFIPKYRSRQRTLQWIRELIQLGWRKQFVYSTFYYLDDFLLANWPFNVFTEGIFTRMIRIHGFRDSITTSLRSIGLRKKIAQKMDKILSPLLGSCYTHDQVLDCAIEYILAHHTPQSSSFTHLPFQLDYVHHWISYSIRSKTIKIYNIPYLCHHKEAIHNGHDALINIRYHSDTKHRYYFHATSWTHSLSIMNGIDRFQGKFFSNKGGYGFYLYPSLSDSIKWCKRHRMRWNHQTCILLFRLPKQLPASLSLCHLSSSTTPFEQYDFVYRDSSPTELVAHTNEAQSFLHQHLFGCIYFQSYPSFPLSKERSWHL